jgi:hypothetical protein
MTHLAKPDHRVLVREFFKCIAAPTSQKCQCHDVGCQCHDDADFLVGCDTCASQNMCVECLMYSTLLDYRLDSAMKKIATALDSAAKIAMRDECQEHMDDLSTVLAESRCGRGVG